MKLKRICLLLFGVLFLLLLKEITCIANNYNHEENLIGEEDRRAAESYEKTGQPKSQANKRGLYESTGTYTRHQSYPSGYGDGASGYSYLPVAHQQPSSYGHSYPSYTSGYGSYGHVPSYGHTSQGHGHSALALKGLLIPLAGIALLGAAAALSTNPVLLQLGVVNGRRRRRSLNSDVYPSNPVVKPCVKSSC